MSNNNFWVRKWWNSRTVDNKSYLRYFFLFNLLTNVLSQYSYLGGQSKIEKSVDYSGRIVIFTLKNSKKLSFSKLDRLTGFTMGAIATRNYQVQILESTLLEYEQGSFRVDFRERMTVGAITAEMLSQGILSSNRSFTFSALDQIRGINRIIKKNNQVGSSKFRKENVILKKLV